MAAARNARFTRCASPFSPRSREPTRPDVYHRVPGRSHETQELVRESQRRRYKRVEDVDDVIALDAKWRDARWELDQANSEFNKANKAVSR